ncbi:unknown (plasmid) [Haloarcula marismortui ATCC 43049]|uniref:Uncharacterized protein n=1 Tax=Haloarcula marismortui (strain ATCC 43049 / DSM 3752 / JCM 8966 / VKM B-1809) TaxID=272569 RepID=Q5V6S9_HALMA|nr:hypothetical protein [Haloarcula marismortui]AAV44773.1 unknown [Haloarcula marismortui ATCC 43049]QCP90089.1 hypothetical protein E6P14_04225 [Haloarcula marismortui ATCC 43049]
MDRRYVIGLAVALVAIGIGLAAFTAPWSPQTTSPGLDETYPAGAGPDHINFSALEEDDMNVSHTPREYWDSYAIIYTAPPDRPLIEGDYYINSNTGEILADRWHNATVYRNGTTYAAVQLVDDIPNERQREELESDDSYVYHDATDAYYRYDPRYGQIAPTNIGRHPDLLDGYTWTATNRTTHHGVSVITYRVTGKRATAADDAPPLRNGTLSLGVEDGIVYAFDITFGRDGRTGRYTYDVRPASFPDHSWVDTARAVASENATESSAR